MHKTETLIWGGVNSGCMVTTYDIKLYFTSRWIFSFLTCLIDNSVLLTGTLGPYPSIFNVACRISQSRGVYPGIINCFHPDKFLVISACITNKVTEGNWIDSCIRSSSTDCHSQYAYKYYSHYAD